MDLASLRRPEYTGSNRCWPCTVLNVVLVSVSALVLARRDRPLLGVATALVGTVAVALRGYVVPYTPAVGPRIVAALPLPDGVFENHAPETETASLTAADLDGEAVLSALADAEAVEVAGGLIRPTEAVDEAWHAEMGRLADGSLAALAREATALPGVSDAAAYEDDRGAWLAIDGDLVARPVAVAEVAAYRTLDGVVPDRRTRVAGASAFRMFLERCPVCETTLVESSEVSCCGGYTDPQTAPEDVLVCPACEQRLYTFQS